MAIGPFRDEYRWLSNFWYAEIYMNGNTYPTTEHLYQIAKCANPEDMRRIIAVATPKEAKVIGQTVELTEGWDDMKLNIMLTVTVLKYTQNTGLADKLIATGDEEIVEINHWCDNYWGVCNCKKCDGKLGENHLGKILMQVRDIIKLIHN